jgi:hypothetical protein
MLPRYSNIARSLQRFVRGVPVRWRQSYLAIAYVRNGLVATEVARSALWGGQVWRRKRRRREAFARATAAYVNLERRAQFEYASDAADACSISVVA